MPPPKNDEFPPIETEHLHLRQLTARDIDFVFDHFSNPLVNRFLLDEAPVTEYSQTQEIVNFYLEQAGKPYNRWLITRRSDQQPIGTCGFHKWEQRFFRAEIGYDLSPEFWGNGFMSEALHAIIAFGFMEMGLNRIEALVYTENDRSIRLLQKLGFMQEARLHDYFFQGGIFYDHYLFALLKNEWKTPS